MRACKWQEWLLSAGILPTTYGPLVLSRTLELRLIYHLVRTEADTTHGAVVNESYLRDRGFRQ